VREHRWPISGEQIWLAAYDGSGDWPYSTHQYGLTLAPRDGPIDPEMNGHVIALAIGYLVFRLMGNTLRQGTIDTPAWHVPGTLIPIWPATGEMVKWPPSAIVSGNRGLRGLVDSVGSDAADNSRLFIKVGPLLGPDPHHSIGRVARVRDNRATVDPRLQRPRASPSGPIGQ
jgi:hypothetical protein